MRRPAPYHHGGLRDALIEAAQAILESEGSAALSLRAVARRAGVSPAAPYHHFPDKQALLDAVAERGFDALTAAMTERMDRAGGNAARLDASGIGYVAFAVANPALFSLMFSHVGQNPAAGQSLDLARQRAYGVLQQAADAASTGADRQGEPGRMPAVVGHGPRHRQAHSGRLRETGRFRPRRWRSAGRASPAPPAELEHVPEKWKPVFRKGHAKTNEFRAPLIQSERDVL